MEGSGIWYTKRVVLPYVTLDQELGDVGKLGMREQRAPPGFVLAVITDEIPHDAAQDQNMSFALIALPWLLRSQPLDEEEG